jgi:hypothetical protein
MPLSAADTPYRHALFAPRLLSRLRLLRLLLLTASGPAAALSPLLLKAASRSGLARLFSATPVQRLLCSLHSHESLSFLEAAQILIKLARALENLAVH